MEKISLIAMDMDGTLLLDGGKGIPADNIAAIREAHQAGIHLALCSGRIPDDMGFYALDTGVPMHILALNGTCTLDKPLGAIVQSDHIPEASALAVFDLIQHYPVAYGIFCDHDLVVSQKLSDSELLTIFGNNILREGTRTAIHFGRESAAPFLHRGVNKFMVFTLNDPETLARLRPRLEQEISGIDVCSSWINNLEINPQGANKGVALRALARQLDIPLSQVMAIGDNDNDLPMLEASGVPVSMGNGSQAAKTAAKYITLNNQDCGVAAAIRFIALGQDIPGVRRQ